MCDAMTVLSIAGSAFQYVQGQQAASDAAAAQRANLEAQYQQTAEKQKQINEKAALESHERMKQGMIDRAEAKTIAGESGALGLSANRLIADSYMQEGTDLMSIDLNRRNQIKQTDWENKSARAKAQGGTNEAYNKAPSAIGTGLQIGGDIYAYKNKVETESKG